MKKLYTIALAAAATLTAAAANNLEVSKSLQTAPVKQQNVKAVEGQTVVKSLNKVSDVNTKSMKAPAANTLEGTWEFAFGDWYFSTSIGGTVYAEFEATVSGSLVYFEDPSNNELPFVGTYNAADGTITFEREYLGYTGQYYIYQQPHVFDYTTGDLVDKDQLIGTLSEDGQSITFESDMGLQWLACSDENGMDVLGYFSIYDFEGATKSASWAFVATGSFKENVIYGTFTGNENTQFADVDIYANPAVPGIYKVKDPYKTLYADLGFSSVSPDLLIDATDPDNVMVELQSIGINGGSTDGSYYLFNEGWYCAEYDDELDPELVCTMTKDDDGNVEMIFPYHSFTIYAATSQKFYYGSSAESILRFKEQGGSEGSVDNIGVDSNNAPVELYNLQGVRVDNPAAGTIVIKKQGTTVSKHIVR